MEPTRNDIVDRLSSLLAGITVRTSVADVRQAVALRSERTKRRLVQTIGEIWQNPRILENEGSRVLLARLVSGLIPYSTNVVHEMLATPAHNELHAELQFSVFVAFSDLPQILSRANREILRREVEGFLNEVQTDVAQAAWMAGDLLGDHWPVEEAVPLLIRLAQSANHRAGREAAIHGLSHLVSRATKIQQWEIVGVLKSIAANDIVPATRNYAESVIGELRGI
jgi:hypothetical protein